MGGWPPLTPEVGGVGPVQQLHDDPLLFPPPWPSAAPFNKTLFFFLGTTLMSLCSGVSIQAVSIRPQFTFNTYPLHPHHTLYVPLNVHMCMYR